MEKLCTLSLENGDACGHRVGEETTIGAVLVCSSRCIGAIEVFYRIVGWRAPDQAKSFLRSDCANRQISSGYKVEIGDIYSQANCCDGCEDIAEGQEGVRSKLMPRGRGGRGATWNFDVLHRITILGQIFRVDKALFYPNRK